MFSYLVESGRGPIPRLRALDGSLREPVVAEWHCGMIISLRLPLLKVWVLLATEECPPLLQFLFTKIKMLTIFWEKSLFSDIIFMMKK
jgi:hypothetical protein